MSPELAAVAEFLTGSQAAARALPWRLLGKEDIRVVRAWAAESMPLPAQQRLFRELRAAIKQPVEDPPEGDPLPVVSAGLVRARRQAAPAGGPLSARQARVLLELCRHATDASGLRDRAVISLMLLAGLRSSEVSRLQSSDFDESSARLDVSTPFREKRCIVLEGDCLQDVLLWLDARGPSGGSLLVAFAPRGHVLDKPISPGTVRSIVRRRCHQAGLSDVRPTDLRRRFLRQLQTAAPANSAGRGRYYLGEDGRPAWVLPSLRSIEIHPSFPGGLRPAKQF